MAFYFGDNNLFVRGRP